MKFGNFVTEFLHKGYWLLVIEVRAHNAVAIKGLAPTSLRGAGGLARIAGQRWPKSQAKALILKWGAQSFVFVRKHYPR